MLIRKLSEAIRKQDWFAVVVETLVVVVGIFLALQVDAWNQWREDRELEQRYLERLQAEIARDIESIEFGLELAWTRHDMGRMLEAALDDPSVARDNPAEFVTAIERAGWTFLPPINDSTFEEIKFSGNLGIILNEELRQSIAAYYKLIERNHQWSYMREAGQIAYTETSIGILTTEQHRKIDIVTGREVVEGILPTPEFTVEEALAALEKMKATPEFTDQLVRGTSKSDEIYSLRSWLSEGEKLREAIAAELEVRWDGR